MPQPTKCPLCKNVSDLRVYPIGSVDSYRIMCPRCGEYKITEEALYQIGDRDLPNAYLLSGLVRESNEIKVEPSFLTTNMEMLMNSYPVPKPNDIEGKAKKLLERLKVRTEYFGQTIDLLYQNDYPLAYAKNQEEFIALIKLLNGNGYVNILNQTNVDITVALSASGWGLVNNLESDNKNSDQGFIAIWFDDSMNDSINAIQAAISDTGFKGVCIRSEHFSERIMDKALGEIRKSRFVVVDLTGGRSSVFFEAGFAHGLNIDVIYVYKDSEDGTNNLPLEFYVRHYQCYKYENPDELREVLKNAIAARIKNK